MPSPVQVTVGNLSYVKVEGLEIEGLRNSNTVVECNRYCYDQLSRDQSFTNWSAAKVNGCKSWGDVEAVLVDGWPKGAESAMSLSVTLGDIPQVANMRRKLVRSDEGTELLIDPAMAGDWDQAWLRSAKRGSAPLVSVATNVGANAHVSAESLMWSGVQALALVDALENAGYRVEVHGIFPARYSSGATIVDLVAKRYHEPLRIDRLSTMLAHGGFLRSYTFHALSHGSHEHGSSYGKYIDDPSAQLEQLALAGLCDRPTLYMPSAYTREQAMENIKAALAKVNASR